MPNKNPAISISPRLLLLFPAALLIIPFPWVLAVLCSVLIHELCHIAAARLMGKQIFLISVGSSGAEILTDMMNDTEELIVSLAGPASCLIALFLARHFPRFAVCSVIHTVYNLLPLYPLDGGRAFRCITRLLLPQNTAKQLSRIVESICIFILVLAFLGVAVFLRIGFLPILAGVILAVRYYKRKKSCKDSQLRVQ